MSRQQSIGRHKAKRNVYPLARNATHRPTARKNTAKRSKGSGWEAKGPLLYWTLWWRTILDDSQEATGSEPGTIALLDECKTDCSSRRGYYKRHLHDT